MNVYNDEDDDDDAFAIQWIKAIDSFVFEKLHRSLTHSSACEEFVDCHALNVI